MNNLYILLSSVLAATLVVAYIYYTYETKESFKSMGDDLIVYSCPSSMNQYTSLNGDELCCDGDVEGRKCRGKTVCAISSTNSDIPSCSIYKKEHLQKQAAKYCPTNMPNYYENKTAKGCTAGLLNKTADAPLYSSNQYCIVYDKITDAIKDKNSCYLQHRLEKMIAPQNTVGKSLISTKGSYIPSATYLMNDIPIICVDKESFQLASAQNKIDATSPYFCENVK
jgi:hypothetical protein